MQISRRHFIVAGAAASAATVAAACTVSSSGSSAPKPAATGALRPLPIPKLAESTVKAGVREFELDIIEGTTEIVAGKSTPTWGYSGSILGPTLRAKNGEKLRITVNNKLGEMTTVHWHGMHLPAIFDGGPHQPIEPQKTWTPAWTVKQQAATLWYHPHPHGATGRHTFRGLAGVFIIDDDNAAAKYLPSEYGIDDIPLLVQDKRFLDDGSLDMTDQKDLGLVGDTIVTNGMNGTYFEVQREALRLRLLNGSTMRVFNIQFSDRRKFHLIASDGGYIEKPSEVDRVILSPGERVEIVARFQPGETVLLNSMPIEDNLGVDSKRAPNFGLQDSFNLVEFRANQPLKASRDLTLTPLNSTLSAPAEQSGMQRTFELERFMINNKRMDMTRLDDIIQIDQPEVWSITNKHGWVHNFHIHDTQFRVLQVTDTESDIQKEGWKDTILLPPGATARIAIRFTDYADNRWPYMYHCHLMFHEDQGMMGQFIVVKPGDKAASILGIGNGASMEQMPGMSMPATP